MISLPVALKSDSPLWLVAPHLFCFSDWIRESYRRPLLSCSVAMGHQSLTMFKVIPTGKPRLWKRIVVRLVAFLVFLRDKAERLKQSACDLYSELRPLPETVAFIGMTSEHAIHRYLSRVQGDFELTPLHSSHPPYTLHLPKPFQTRPEAWKRPFVLLLRRSLLPMEVCRNRVMLIPTSRISLVRFC